MSDINDIDTNIQNYTISELMVLLDLQQDELTANNIMSSAQQYINMVSKAGKKKLAIFFNEVEQRLLAYIDGDPSFDNEQMDGEDESEEDEEEDEEEKQVLDSEENNIQGEQASEWLKNQYLKQNNENQMNKVTQREQKIEVFDNQQVPLKRQQLGINNTFDVPVAQGVMNPNLKNVTSRLINLDSQYRQSAAVNETSTDYTLDLSDTLSNVLSLRLYSFEIPFTWYVIDNSYGNSHFWVSFIDGTGSIIQSIEISLASGNYNTTNFVTSLTTSLTNAGFDLSTTVPPNTAVSIDPISSKVTLNLFGATYSSGAYTVDETTLITFFDFSSQIDKLDDLNNVNCASLGEYLDLTLGWLMGYRLPYITVKEEGNIAPAIINLYGPKYLILVIDDLNQNHLNDGLVGITETSKKFKMPSYYIPQPYTCIDANPNPTINPNLPEKTGTNIIDSLDYSYSPTPQVLPRAPRNLTTSQIYALNEIIKNNHKSTNYRLKSPVMSDTFAVIPLKLGSMETGGVYVDFGGSLQDNKRQYFGPVNIERLRIKLYDDKGRILNLNGNDWAVTLISECLYQY